MNPANPYPDDPAQERALAFDFVQTAPDRFASHVIPSGLLRLYGGMVAAQALATAQATVPEDKAVHSLHAYFLKPGLTDRPLDFSVRRLTDGRSFAARQISVTQDDKPIVEMMASFQTDEAGRTHAFAMPDVPPPDDLPILEDLFAAHRDTLPDRHRPYWLRRQQLEWRPCEPFLFGQSEVLPPRRNFWFRMKQPLQATEAEHRRWLVYASDFHIFQTGLLPLGLGWDSNYLQTSSLDHAIWFHGAVDMNEWMLYALETPAASGARTLSRGSMYRADGTLIATVTQQGLLRELAQEREGKI
ncbi:acyl-CoA thioesterase II [Croceicoccus ponticola]|uniref:Acyl-CoA thioesterase II n=1 Tax=Croceicoccus ponticola TaxID=2217664 RepID=A0A437GZA0_9SPHN|nr:acyl-CoA thioesterase domain-containing protein [Croceicoccus ponticola]RVQ68681.1 acyl-CoA thioesterase II [Croceicoccus ponticola]